MSFFCNHVELQGEIACLFNLSPDIFSSIEQGFSLRIYPSGPYGDFIWRARRRSNGRYVAPSVITLDPDILMHV